MRGRSCTGYVAGSGANGDGRIMEAEISVYNELAEAGGLQKVTE